MATKRTPGYRVGTLEKGLAILETLEASARPLSVKDVAEATGIERTGVFRLLSTLVHRGYVTRDAGRKYSCLQWRRKLTLAYLAPLHANPFQEDLLAGIEAAAAHPHIRLLALENGVEDAQSATENAIRVSGSGADVAAFFQPDAAIAHMLASRFAEASLPRITVCSPVEGVVYVGPENYACGKLAGRRLALHALSRWQGNIDFMAALEPSQMGAESLARVSGMKHECAAMLGRRCQFRVLHTTSRVYREEARRVFGEVLAGLPSGARVALGCFNDPVALGALDAARAVGRAGDVAVISQNGTEEARAELLRPDTGLIATIGYFPRLWGEKLVRLAMSMANGQAVPPSVSVETAVLTRGNVRRYYPEPAAHSV
jgi:ribose transport system substrate-binding protein